MIVYNGKTLNITKYLAYSIDPLLENYDLFSLQPEHTVNEIFQLGEKLGTFNVENGFHLMFTLKFADISIERKTLYLIANIESTVKRMVILNSTMPINSKIWCNNKLISIRGINPVIDTQENDWNNVCFELNEGKNELLFEVYHPAQQLVFENQLVDYAGQSFDSFTSFQQLGPYTNYKDIQFVTSKMLYNPNELYSFMVINNMPWENKRLCYYLFDSIGNTLITNNMDFNKKIDLKISSLACNSPDYDDPGYFLAIDAFTEARGHQIMIHPIVLTSIDEKLEHINKVAYAFLEQASEEIQTSSVLAWYMEKQDETVTYAGNVTAFKTYYDIKALLEDIIIKLPGQPPFHMDSYYDYTYLLEQYIANPKEGIEIMHFPVQLHSYLSKIDESIERVLLRIPRDYNHEKKMPLVIACSVFHYSYYSYDLYNSSFCDQFILADVTMRGQSLGCFAGEQSFFEALSLIKEKYNIDEERIYLIGCSNGGYSTWHFIQKYPHLFAGAFPLGGLPNPEELINVSNINIYVLTSDQDKSSTLSDESLSILNQNPHFHLIECNQNTHSQIIRNILNQKIINALLKEKKNCYPNTIQYITFKNRYLKAYWITLHGIEALKPYASVNAHIEKSNTINVAVDNASGLTITIPPYLDRTNLIVTINNLQFEYNDCKLTELHYSYDKVNKTYTEVTEENIKYGPPEKGNGLFEIFYQNLKIIMPDEAPEEIESVFPLFFLPKTNAIYEQLNVRYPFYTDSNVNKEILYNNSLVLLSFNQTLGCLKQLHFKEYISMSANGFQYMQEKYTGKYLIIQIVPSEINKELYLYIETNTVSYYRQMFLLRNFRLSSDFNGQHPYYNNVALIYLNGDYYKIEEWGAPLTVIEKLSHRTR